MLLQWKHQGRVDVLTLPLSYAVACSVCVLQQSLTGTHTYTACCGSVVSVHAVFLSHPPDGKETKQICWEQARRGGEGGGGGYRPTPLRGVLGDLPPDPANFLPPPPPPYRPCGWTTRYRLAPEKIPIVSAAHPETRRFCCCCCCPSECSPQPAHESR